MLFKTHLALALAGALFLIPLVNYKLIFLVVVLLSTLIPDMDSYSSIMGNRWYLRPFQWATKHRGVLHSFSSAIFISILLALFIPILALPFFLGYSIHLFADSFTKDGIRPFWPLKDETSGRIPTGGRIEEGIFYGTCLINIILFIRLFI